MEELYRSVGIAVLCWYCANKSNHMIKSIKGHGSAALSQSLCGISGVWLAIEQLLYGNQHQDMWARWSICWLQCFTMGHLRCWFIYVYNLDNAQYYCLLDLTSKQFLNRQYILLFFLNKFNIVHQYMNCNIMWQGYLCLICFCFIPWTCALSR